MTRAAALQNGMAYTHIGNTYGDRQSPPSGRKDGPTYR